MKLNNFENGSSKPKGDYKVIVGDTKEKAELKDEIDKLSQYVDANKRLEKENSRLKADLDYLKDLSSKQTQSIVSFSEAYSDNVEKLSERAALYEQVKNYKTQVAGMENTVRSLKETNKTVFDELNTAQRQLLATTSENAVYAETQKQYVADKTRLQRQADSATGELSSLKEDHQLAIKRLKELDISHATLLQEKNQISQLLTESKLSEEESIKREGAAKAEADRNIKAFQRIKKASNQVDATIKHLTEENKNKSDELNSLEKQYNTLRVEAGLMYAEIQRLRQEAEKPRYSSISMIERAEGFKLPRNFEPRKNFLGNAKPTLLKVRTE